ncbi:T9SS type A sorting domain-containing protein [Hymenobacter sp. BRD67]|nr:T9SS type A sorting domain-containing protein [Hymenobacter sp. BRD67]
MPAPFQPLRADAQFQFVLAPRDPNGNPLPEPGIDRIDRSAWGFDAPPYEQGYIDSIIKPGTDWNPDQYVNIWVLQLGGNVLGYAQYPDNTAGLGGLSPLGGAPATDGVVILYSAFGRVGTLLTNYDQGRTLTHELGHWLGLRHIWGDAVCGDDYCADTPPQDGPNLGCPAFPHLSVNCPNGPSGDMFMNFLDYSPDACMELFSADQKSRMQAVMAASTPRRAVLLTSPALCTGTPVAATASSGPVCAGSSAQLTATGPAGASYDWTGPNGFSSTLQNPVLPAVTAAQAGIYTVHVAVTTGACPTTASTTLVVNPSPPTPLLATSTTAFCPSASASVTLSVTNPLPGGEYSWSVVSGDGLPAGATTPSIGVTPTQSSTYLLTVALPGSGCAASATVSVQVLTPIWSGAAGTGSWFDAANWTGCVPSRSTDALIPAGLSTPYPTISGGTAEVRTLTQQGPLTLTGGELDLYGDYTGTGPLSQTGGTVATRGDGPQSLRSLTYQTLAIGGTGTKTIGAATITQALAMSGALLNTGTAVLTMAPTAILSETDASYVLGQVQTTHVVGTTPDSFGNLGLTLTAAVAPGSTTLRRTTGQPLSVGRGQSISRYYDVAAAVSRGLQGATLTHYYLPHELNNLAESQLVLVKSPDAGSTWSSEGATQRDATARAVSRRYVADLNGRWTLAAGPDASPAATAYAINAFPVPFSADGLSFQVTTPTAGPLAVQLYDVLGRVIYSHDVATVEVGTSIVNLPGSGSLRPGKYILVVRQAGQQVRLNVERE